MKYAHLAAHQQNKQQKQCKLAFESSERGYTDVAASVKKSIGNSRSMKYIIEDNAIAY